MAPLESPYIIRWYVAVVRAKLDKPSPPGTVCRATSPVLTRTLTEWQVDMAIQSQMSWRVFGQSASLCDRKLNSGSE